MWKRTAALVVFLVPAAGAQTPDPLGRDNPRNTVTSFLQAAYERNDALMQEYLERPTRPQTARQLEAILNSATSLDLNRISDSPDGNLTDLADAASERIVTVAAGERSLDIVLRRVEREDRRIWVFASETLDRVPAIYSGITPDWAEAFVPDGLKHIDVYGIPAWRLFLLLLLIPIAGSLAWLISVSLLWIVGSVSRRTSTGFDDSVVAILRGPLGLFIAVLLFHAGALFIGLPLLFRQRLAHVELIVGVFAICWFLLRLADLASTETHRLLVRTNRVAAISMVPLGRRMAKVLILVLAVLAVLDNAGFDLKAVLTGLGVGGIAVALAAQRTLENIFGGIALVLDQPIRVGDFCKFGDHIGTVEDIGLRSTRIRTLDRTLISVPNAQFSTLNLENFAAREKVWFHPTLRLRLDSTADQIQFVLAEVRRMLHRHARVEPGGRIRLVSIGQDSLNLEIFSYVTTSDYGEFVAIQEDLLFRIMEIVESAGTSFAAPAQTTYIARDHGIKQDRASVALETVQGWKKSRKMPFPDYPPEEIAAMEKLPYPPPESGLAAKPEPAPAHSSAQPPNGPAT